MHSLAALAAAGLLALAAQPPGPAVAVPFAADGADGVSVEAGSITFQSATGRYLLEDGVVLRRGLVVVRARAATLDPSTGELQATGGVLLTDATRAVAADGLQARLDGPFVAENVVAFLKDGPVDLGGATTVEEARRTGPNRLLFSGARLAGDGSGDLTLGGARVTLCDCGGAAPSWEIRAREAEIRPGERATLRWPVLYVTPRFLFIDRPVPVLAIPWLYLPLGERQTGLLAPAVASTGATGLAFSQPVFVTLGRSADLTVTPEYYFGRGFPFSSAGAQPSVRGPGARLELRWAPAVGSEGLVEVAGVRDLDRDPGGSGDRLGINGYHAQRLGAAAHLRADVALASDPVWNRDFTPDVLLQQAFYRRSAARLTYAGEGFVLEAGGAYHQPLTPAGWPGGLSYGPFGADLPVFHRWPSLSGSLLPARLGPVLLSARAGLARFAPVRGFTSDGGLDRLGPGDREWAGRAFALGPGELDGAWQPGERLAVTRADLRAELSLPLLLAEAVSFTPYVRGAAVGYGYDAALDPEANAWAVFGAAASVELSRSYGAARHRIVPRVEYRGGTAALGDPAAVPAYDALDRVRNEEAFTFAPSPEPGAPLATIAPRRRLTAAPEGKFHQLRVAVDTELAGPRGLLRLTAGQDLDLGEGRFAETFLSALALAGPLQADVSARLLAIDGRVEAAPAPAESSWLDELTELRAGVGLHHPRGHAVRAGLLAVGAGASGTLMAGLDPLFDLRPAAIPAAAQGTFSARAVLGPATLGYDALFPGRATPAPSCSGTGTRLLDPLQVQQHVGSFVWDSPCRCFLARIAVRFTDCGYDGVSGSIDLAQLTRRTAIR